MTPDMYSKFVEVHERVRGSCGERFQKTVSAFGHNHQVVDEILG